MQYKVKTKDCRLIVKAKASRGEEFDEKALDAFTRVYMRGFLKPQSMGKGTIEYSGPMGISLHDRLKKPISKHDFLLIMEQTVVAVQKIYNNKLMMNRLLLDPHYVFVNEITKEVLFLYIPTVQNMVSAGVVAFIESLVYTAIPMTQMDAEVISRFAHFLKNQRGFSPEEIEKYIEHEDQDAVNAVKKLNMGQSGFITSKKASYYDHYEKKKANEAPVVQPVYSAPPAQPVYPAPPAQPVYPTSPVQPVYPAPPAQPVYPAPTAQPAYPTQPVYPAAAQPTYGNPPAPAAGEAFPGYGTYPQSVPSGSYDAAAPQANGAMAPAEEADQTELLVEETALLMPEDEEGTMLLEEPRTQLVGVLQRTATNEMIYVRKAVFRLGKDKNSADYCVTDNKAVSRNHADVIMRDEEFFIKDLNSLNHTYINDQIIPPQTETQIHPGDQLRLGNENFIFQTELEEVGANAAAPVNAAPVAPAAAAVKSKFCIHCGRELGEGYQFCVFCGRPV